MPLIYDPPTGEHKVLIFGNIIFVKIWDFVASLQENIFQSGFNK